MIWLNLLTSNLRAPEFVSCGPVARATWLCVLAYCVEQENRGIISGAKDWGDRRWQQTCGVTLKEVNGSSPLLSWDNSDLFVWAYPSDKQAEVEAKREAGRVGGVRSGQARREAQLQAQLKANLERKGMEGKGREGNLPTASQSAEIKLESDPALEEPKPKKQRERDPLFDALAVACGSNPREFTTTAARGCAIALADIRKVAPELTAAELTRRAENYRLHFPDAACTVFAIAKHWAQCGERPVPRHTTTQRPNQNPNYGTKCELAFFPQ